MASLKEYLSGQKLIDQIPLPTAIDALLRGLQIVETTPADAGTVQAGLDAKPLLLDIALKPGGPKVPYTVTRPLAGGFTLTIDLTNPSYAAEALALLDKGVAAVLRPAVAKKDPAAKVDANGKPLAADEWLEETPAPDDRVKLTGLGFAIVVEGTKGAPATLRYTPSTIPGTPESVLPFSLDPPAVLFGDTGFGLALGGNIVLDLSTTAAPGVPASVDGKPVAMPSESVPAWKGLAIHKARLFLPASVPLFGRTACDVAIDIGLSPPGIQLALTAHAPARDDMPAMDLRIECIDPAATGLSSFAPTLVEAVVTLPVSGTEPHEKGTLTLLGGDPVLARARFSRDPSDPLKLTRLSIALESQGPNGIAMVKPTGRDDKLGIATVGAAGLATALIADNKLAAAGSTKHGGTMAALMTAGMVLTAILSDKGKLVVNRLDLASAGHGLPVGQPLVFSVDYSVDVPIKPLNIGLLSISLDPERLLRIRMRGVTLTYDPAKAGLDRVALDFEHATMDVEDAGNWKVDGAGSLFDVLGTRSGKGSIWLEIDLRFKLDLGPIKVSGATIRATLDPGTGKLGVSLRGLDAALSIPALVKADGKIALIAAGQEGGPGFSARLDAKILPLKVAATASVTLKQSMILVNLGVDLPGPVPLGPTGFGLFGLTGTVGIGAAIAIPPDPAGPIAAQIKWTPDKGFSPAPGQFSFGAGVSVGTLPDLGFNFSAKAGLFVTVPDLAILGSLDARFLSGPVSVTDQGGPANNSVRGTISLLPKTGVSFALLGTFGIPKLVTATIPVAGAFPPGSDEWYVYVGSDGVEDGNGRGIGPVKMTVLPDLFTLKAQAYLMLRGNGIDKWRGGVTIPSGFVLAFGFAMEMKFGPKPVVWAEVNGGIDVLVATGPLVIAGFGNIDGAIHIGPVSLGVSARITVSMTDNSTYVMAEVCGRIHLLFVTIHKCARLSFGGVVTPVIPDPAYSPLDLVSQAANGTRIVTGQDVNLLDDRYRKLAPLPADPAKAPVVWPDALIRIGFAWPPAVAPTALAQFKVGSPEGPGAKPVGSDFLKYDWTLRSVVVFDDITGAKLPGQFSASWQAGKSGDASVVAQPAELVLMTPQGDLWIDRIDQPGKTPPASPAGPIANACRTTVTARAGWTVATGIAKIMQPTRLPPEFVATDPTQSRVAGGLVWTADGTDGQTVAMEALVGTLPAGIALIPPVPIAATQKLAGRDFAGILTLPFLKQVGPQAAASPPALPQWFSATVLLDDWLTSEPKPVDPAGLYGAVVAMWLDPRTAAEYGRMRPLRVFDETGEWTPEFVTLPSKQLGIVFRMPAGRKAGRVTLRWVSYEHFALIGIGGVTATVRAAADAKQKALDDQAASNGAQTKAPPGTEGADFRGLFRPGGRYRVEVALDWKATLQSQDDSGQPKVIGTKNGTWPTQRFYFTTAPDPFAVGGSQKAVSPPVPGSPDELAVLHGAQNAFAPEMLVRHLAGYEPAQSVVDRFRNDSLRVHFGVGHVGNLAKLYGYTLGLGLRRTDVAGPEGELTLPAFKLVAPTTDQFLKGAAKAHWDLAKQTPCAVPVQGATMDAPVQLAPRAWYELYVRATHAKAPEAALPGVTFRTSRWTDATDMMAGLAFPTSGWGTPGGDIALPASVPAIASAASDTAYDAALAALGLDGWPVPLEPRASVLWRRQPTDGRWAVAGLLLESPEPIERPNRVGPVGLETRLGPNQPQALFATRVSDRTGSRILWLTAMPFVPAIWFAGPPVPALQRPPLLALTLTDRPLDKPATNLVGLLRLPVAPLFAGEAI